MGKYVYGEWLVPIVDYYTVIKKKEAIYEIIIPIIISITLVIFCCIHGISIKALIKLRDMLPNTLAILIGFTITCITVLISNDNKNIQLLKNKPTDERYVANKKIYLYQWLLIMFVYVLIIQIMLLAFVFLASIFLQLNNSNFIAGLLLSIETYLIIHILLIIIRSITNFYFVFFRKIE